MAVGGRRRTPRRRSSNDKRSSKARRVRRVSKRRRTKHGRKIRRSRSRKIMRGGDKYKVGDKVRVVGMFAPEKGLWGVIEKPETEPRGGWWVRLDSQGKHDPALYFEEKDIKERRESWTSEEDKQLLNVVKAIEEKAAFLDEDAQQYPAGTENAGWAEVAKEMADPLRREERGGAAFQPQDCKARWYDHYAKQAEIQEWLRSLRLDAAAKAGAALGLDAAEADAVAWLNKEYGRELSQEEIQIIKTKLERVGGWLGESYLKILSTAGPEDLRVDVLGK